jgi:hypothetical protein
VKLGDAGAAEEIQPVVSDLSFNKLGFVKLLPAERALFFVDVLRSFASPDHGFEAEERNGQHEEEKHNCKNCDRQW